MNKTDYVMKKALTIERNQWLESLSIDGKDRLLFELEMLLKGTERFFNIDNLPISHKEQAIGKNFHNELKILTFIAKRIVSIIRFFIIDESSSAFYFQSYIENRLLADHARDKVIELYLTQSSPRDSLYLLYITFLNLANIYESASQNKKVPFSLYMNLGQITSREISVNKYFSPIPFEPFFDRYDKIHDHNIRGIVSQIADDNLRLKLSVVFLSLFRLLRFMRYIKNESEDFEELKTSILIFTLVNSEAKTLTKFLEEEFLKYKTEVKYREKTVSTIDSLAFQLSIELRKVFDQILKDSVEIGNLTKLKVIVDSAKGILSNFIQQSIILLAQSFDPYIKGKEIFPDFISKVEQSLRLREDIWLFKSVVEFFEQNTNENGSMGSYSMEELFNIVRDYIYYFQDIGFSLVRYSDHEGFEGFFDRLSMFRDEDLLNKFKLSELRKTMHNLKIYLETTLGHIENRAELKNIPPDLKHLNAILSQFISKK